MARLPKPYRFRRFRGPKGMRYDYMLFRATRPKGERREPGPPPPPPLTVSMGSGLFRLYGTPLFALTDLTRSLDTGVFVLDGGNLFALADTAQALESGDFVLVGSDIFYELISDITTGDFLLSGGELEYEIIPIPSVTFDTGVFALSGNDLYQDPPLARPLETGVLYLSGGRAEVYTYAGAEVGQLSAYLMTKTPPSYRVGQLAAYIVYRAVPVIPIPSLTFDISGGELNAVPLRQNMGAGSFELTGGALGAAIIPEYMVGAWGLRRLVDSYVGPFVRIRDTNDNTEFDVGQDGSGNLLPVSTIGEARVVKVYDQTAYGSDVGQSSAALQPLLVQNVTPKGGPAIKFDGSTTFLEDPIYSTTRPYLVAKPSVWMGIGMSTPNQAWAHFYSIPHNRAVIGAPHSRMGHGVDNVSPYILATRTNGTETRNLIVGGIRREHGWNFFAHTAELGLLQNGIDQSKDETISTQATVTYPNNTNIMFGRNNQTNTFWGGYFVEAIVVDNAAALFSASQIKAEIQQRKRDVLTVEKQLWRLRITDNFNNGTGDRTSRFSQLRFNATAGGSELTIADQPAFASHRNSLSEGEHQLFNTTNTNVWSSGNVAGPHYVGVDFGQARNPEELVLVSMQITGAANQALMPRTFDVQYMDAAGSWVTVKSVDLTSEGVGSAQTYTIDLT